MEGKLFCAMVWATSTIHCSFGWGYYQTRLWRILIRCFLWCICGSWWGLLGYAELPKPSKEEKALFLHFILLGYNPSGIWCIVPPRNSTSYSIFSCTSFLSFHKPNWLKKAPNPKCYLAMFSRDAVYPKFNFNRILLPEQHWAATAKFPSKTIPWMILLRVSLHSLKNEFCKQVEKWLAVTCIGWCLHLFQMFQDSTSNSG